MLLSAAGIETLDICRLCASHSKRDKNFTLSKLIFYGHMVRRRSGRSFFSWINGLRDGRGQGCGRMTFSPITQRKGEAREVIVDLLQFCLFKTDEFVGAPDNADLCWKIFIFAKFSKRKSSHLKSLVAPFFFLSMFCNIVYD